jgi:uncharacterized UPF0160 family protein
MKHVVTHSGEFHPDDVCAVAVLSLLESGAISVTRTRDSSIIETGGYVVDVGSEYDSSHRRFDHHQLGGAGARENGVPYASFGLVWKEYGKEVAGTQEIADRLDERLVQPIDAMDNGVSVYSSSIEGVEPYTLDKVIFSFRSTWKDEHGNEDTSFMEAVKLVASLITREVKKIGDEIEGEKEVEKIYRASADKTIIVLDKKYPWHQVITKYPEPLFVVYPSDAKWHVKAVWQGSEFFKNRKDFPESWAGKRDAELREITGVPDAVFCHAKRFLAVAQSQEGALQLAKLAAELRD